MPSGDLTYGGRGNVSTQVPSHRCSRNDGSRNGDEERGTLIFNSMEREEYTASARSQIVRDEEWERRRCSEGSEG
jgi:hypothetical protein